MEPEESCSDVNPFSFKAKNSSVKEPKIEPKPQVISDKTIKFDPKEPYYDMSGDKYLVIFNHYSYKRTRYFNNKTPSARNGTDQDVKRLEDTFGKHLGFEVIVHEDLEYEYIWRELNTWRAKDHSGTSCLSIVILTHGDSQGMVYAADRAYDLKSVLGLFENHPTLVNKPKLFFVQACRGEGVDSGTICFDGDMGECNYVTPSHADFLVMRSTVEDYRSYRDIRGSWMIQELCKVLEKEYKTLDLLHIVTKVHQKVAQNYATYTPSNVATHDKKQVPETNFTLTKLLKF